jgi:hypothetical protein
MSVQLSPMCGREREEKCRRKERKFDDLQTSALMVASCGMSESREGSVSSSSSISYGYECGRFK